MGSQGPQGVQGPIGPSDVFVNQPAGLVALVKDAQTTVLSLTLEPGNYLLQISMMLDNGGKNINMVCTHYNGAAVLSVAPMRADSNRDMTLAFTPGHRAGVDGDPDDEVFRRRLRGVCGPTAVESLAERNGEPPHGCN